ncbi:SDR family oxidoreductase [Microbispora sp. GKU 823]|uniref:SDR family oxidoreductase n=1 Tax=Microbispora sp. GKU 823 TaxID=1652100 RepID=UPI0009A38335|nr:SDR family oxidoreductase [Microbispora sp. GKU 823]OPG11391.1 short-chain dehydrogenase [Microbispora sp. GKU 823]
MVGNVLITGGASGLGRATAMAVAKAGGRPLVVDVNEPDGGFDHVRADLADREQAERAVRELADRAGGLDGVVTAAGVDACGGWRTWPPSSGERVIGVNLLGTAAVVRAALPYLRRSGGKVVTVASTLGVRALSDATAYCASKFGVVGFTRALAAELAGQVGVTLLIPGGMQTNFFNDRPDQYKPGPDARLNQPEDVASAILFALGQPQGCEVRELVVCASTETSWP